MKNNLNKIFLFTLSIIFVVAKIFGLVTISWWWIALLILISVSDYD